MIWEYYLYKTRQMQHTLQLKLHIMHKLQPIVWANITRILIIWTGKQLKFDSFGLCPSKILASKTEHDF